MHLGIYVTAYEEMKVRNDGSSMTVSKPVVGSYTQGDVTLKIFGFHTTLGNSRCEKGLSALRS